MNKLSFPRWIVIFAFAYTASLAIAAEPVQVEVKLSDGSNGKMSLNLSTSTVAGGPVEFVVQNQSSSLKHEFMIVPWTTKLDALPYEAKTQQVDEAKLGAMEGVEDLAPGETVTTRMVLAKGRYVVFCNEPGHYMASMRSVFVVK